MSRMIVILAFVICGTATVARAQISVEEAEARMKMRQEMRARLATTQPTTRPTTMPAEWARLRLEDEAREAQLDHDFHTKPQKKNDSSWVGRVWTMPAGEWEEPGQAFGIGMRGRTPSSSSNNRGDVYVHGYFRSDGTYVSGYWRGRPDGIQSNNKN